MPIVSPEFHVYPISNEQTYKIVKEHDCFYWCCSLDPRMIEFDNKLDFVTVINRYKQLGAIGVGEITANLALNDPRVENLLSACSETGMPVTIHWSSLLGRTYGLYAGEKFQLLEWVLNKYPNLKIIGHSVPFWENMFINDGFKNRLESLMENYPNLYCDTSANSGYNAISSDKERGFCFLEKFQDKIIFGLDISYFGEKLYKKILLFYDEGNKDGCISDEIYKKINYKNALALYNIEVCE